MTLADLRVSVVREVDSRPLDELPEVARALVEGMVRIQERLGAHSVEATHDDFITPERAAEIAGVPKRRVYAWARNKKWAVRPTRKTLRISERRFRAWLGARSPVAGA